MIEPRELRIGNYIHEPNNENTDPFKIWSIYYEGGNNKINGYPITYFQPIPLNEEWLLKFGFEKNQYSTIGVQYNEPFYHINLEAKGWRFGYREDFGWIVHPSVSDFNVIPVKYVHQLQNLYFALTGNELIIK